MKDKSSEYLSTDNDSEARVDNLKFKKKNFSEKIIKFPVLKRRDIEGGSSSMSTDDIKYGLHR